MKKRKLNQLSNAQLRNERKRIEEQIKASLGRMKQVLTANNSPGSIRKKLRGEFKCFEGLRNKYNATLSTEDLRTVKKLVAKEK